MLRLYGDNGVFFIDRDIIHIGLFLSRLTFMPEIILNVVPVGIQPIQFAVAAASAVPNILHVE
jgi:hypothetical protein